MSRNTFVPATEVPQFMKRFNYGQRSVLAEYPIYFGT